jgi:hypothetical protein
MAVWKVLGDQAGSLCVYQRSTRQGLCTIIGVGSMGSQRLSLYIPSTFPSEVYRVVCQRRVVALLGRCAGNPRVLLCAILVDVLKDSQWESRLLRSFTEFALSLRKPSGLDWSCCRVVAVPGPGFGPDCDQGCPHLNLHEQASINSVNVLDERAVDVYSQLSECDGSRIIHFHDQNTVCLTWRTVLDKKAKGDLECPLRSAVERHHEINKLPDSPTKFGILMIAVIGMPKDC